MKSIKSYSQFIDESYSLIPVEGYVKGTVKPNVNLKLDKISKSRECLINAIDYTSKGDKDAIRVIVRNLKDGGEILKIAKLYLEVKI